MLYFLYYFIFINVLSVLITSYDKFAAKNGLFRIPEKTLWLLSIIGGALCMFITMHLIRHKTLHRKFMFGIPAVIVLQLVIFFFIYSGVILW